MAKEDFLLGLATAVIALSALMFGIFQAAVAFSQLMSARSRCGRRVTGAFDLRAGIWLSLMSLTPNVKYRMPVLTMPGLRFSIPVMEPDGIPTEFTPGLNFKENAYVDGKRARVYGEPPSPSGPVDRWRTAFTIIRNIVWAPFAAIISLVGCCLCWPPILFCGGCGGPGMAILALVIAPLEPLFHNVKRKRGSGDIERHAERSPNHDLEPSSWAQFLFLHQLAWWGHANIRWEWRLASAIPPDITGATLETTIADLELLALMFGMVPGDDQRVLARSLCGEEIVITHHKVLGRMAFYRSGRENIQNSIWATSPKDSPEWLHLCIEAAQVKQNRFSWPETTLPDSLDQRGLAMPSSSVKNVVGLLSRRRTIYDAQLYFSCGNAMWLYSDHCFVRALNGMWEYEIADWNATPFEVFLGPIGKGANSCSCTSCQKTWHRSGVNYYSPALITKVETDGVVRVGKSVLGGKVELTMHTQKLCWAGCTRYCTCGTVARASQRQDTLSLENSIAIAAINTEWLSKVDDLTLRQASESLLLGLAANPLAKNVWNVSMVIAYTETLLLDVRKQIGSNNMWNTEVREFMSDFSPIAMG